MNTTIARMGRRLRLGVVGGGPGSFIGTVHRAAARLDDHYEIVAAVMSRNPERSRAAARAIGIPEERAYADHGELLAREAERADGIDVLAIMTPNDTHYPIARDALAQRPRRDLRQAVGHESRGRARPGPAGARKAAWCSA